MELDLPCVHHRLCRLALPVRAAARAAMRSLCPALRSTELARTPGRFRSDTRAQAVSHYGHERLDDDRELRNE